MNRYFVWLFFVPGMLCGEPAGGVYSNDFNGPTGKTYPEWTSSPTAS
jgi:hypothetical protein